MSGHSADRVRDWVERHGDELVSIRRRIHAEPELSGQEHATTDLVAERLTAAGLSPRRLQRGTGLVCDIGEGDGPVVALRADLDALAMDDEKDVAYRSRRPGVAHACGHDVHTTVVLGAGLHLAERLRGTGRRVRLVLQPAEETLPGGALDVIADGGLEDVSVIYGLHCEPKLPVGTVGLRVGPITSATDSVTIRLQGPGGHTARPELTVDMIALLGRIITELPGAVRRELGGDPELKLVFGAVRSGAAANVIPTVAELRAAMRTPSIDVWQRLLPALEAALGSLAGDPRLRWELEHTRGVPPVVNDADAIGCARRAVIRSLGAEAVVEAPRSWGGDDFAWYTQQVPGAYLRLGTHVPTPGAPMLDLHAGHFDVDERAIGFGVRLLVAVVEEQLALH